MTASTNHGSTSQRSTVRVLVVAAPCDEAEIAADALWTYGITALEERRVGPVIELRTVVGDLESAAIVGAVAARWPTRIEEVDAAPAETWKRYAAPVRVDDIVLTPEWCSVDGLGGDAVIVSIDPGAAFGLGDHPTTQLCTSLLARRVRADVAAGRAPRVLDVGCGTGVLAIVAARLGARAVVATDTSGVAVENAHHNVDANGVGDVVRVTDAPVGAITDRFDIVVANILSPTLVALADEVRRRAERWVILSGLLAGRTADVEEAYVGWSVHAREVLEGWTAIELSADERSDLLPSGQ
ncbi:MAG: 50S ribosomal protein L11 methyltransferase [Actinomycetota bacterium]